MNKPEYEMSDEELVSVEKPCLKCPYEASELPIVEADETCDLCERQVVARAADKKLVEWLWEYCAEHGQWRRLLCPKCWQNLKKELGIK